MPFAFGILTVENQLLWYKEAQIAYERNVHLQCGNTDRPNTEVCPTTQLRPQVTSSINCQSYEWRYLQMIPIKAESSTSLWIFPDELADTETGAGHLYCSSSPSFWEFHRFHEYHKTIVLHFYFLFAVDCYISIVSWASWPCFFVCNYQCTSFQMKRYFMFTTEVVPW